MDTKSTNYYEEEAVVFEHKHEHGTTYSIGIFDHRDRAVEIARLIKMQGDKIVDGPGTIHIGNDSTVDGFRSVLAVHSKGNKETKAGDI